MSDNHYVKCPDCHGTGRDDDGLCKRCHGACMVEGMIGKYDPFDFSNIFTSAINGDHT